MKKLLAACTTALQALGLARGGNSAPRHAHNRVRITKTLAAFTTAILAVGLAVVGVAAPASAHNQSVTSTCSAVTVNLTNYSATVPAKTTTTYQRYSWTGGNQSTAPTEVPPSQNWNPDTTNYAGAGHGTDPIDTAFEGSNANWFYWVKTVTVTPEKINHVTVTIDGAATPVADTDFSRTYNNTFNFANSTVSHSWTVVVTAWDDPTGSSRWTKTITGSSTACVTPAAPTFIASVCANGAPGNGTFSIPSTSGVKYKYQIGSGSWITGTAGGSPYTLPLNTTVTINASQSGSIPIVGFAGPWTFTATAPAGGCVLTTPTLEPTFTSVCGINQGTYTVPSNGDHYKYTTVDGRVNGVGTVTVTLSATGGYAFAAGTQLTWSHLYANNDCPLVAPPTEPTFTDLCGINQGSFTVPANGQHYGYQTDDGRVNGVGTVTVTLVPEAGYAFPEETTLTWSKTFTNEDCPLVAPPTEPTFTDLCGINQGSFTVPDNGDHYSYSVMDSRTNGIGMVTVVLTPEAGYAFPEDTLKLWSHNYVANDCPLVVPPTEPAFTDLCGLEQDGFTVPADGQHYAYQTDDGRVNGVGTVTVMLVPEAGYAFPEETTLTWSKTFTNEDCPVVIQTDPEVFQPQCVVNEIETTLTSGYITVAVTDHVTYSITGTTDANVAVNLTDVAAQTDLAPGHYTVTATAEAGFVLAGEHVGPWNKTISAYDGVCGESPTLASLPTAVSSTNQVCSADVATGGSITVAQIGGNDNQFAQGVSYFIDGVKVTSVTTAKASGTYHVTATVDNPQDTIDGDSSWTITVAAPSTDCAQLKTLAFTGADGSMGGMLIFALFLLLGGAGVYTASRFRSRES